MSRTYDISNYATENCVRVFCTLILVLAVSAVTELDMRHEWHHFRDSFSMTA